MAELLKNSVEFLQKHLEILSKTPGTKQSSFELSIQKNVPIFQFPLALLISRYKDLCHGRGLLF